MTAKCLTFAIFLAMFTTFQTHAEITADGGISNSEVLNNNTLNGLQGIHPYDHKDESRIASHTNVHQASEMQLSTINQLQQATGMTFDEATQLTQNIPSNKLESLNALLQKALISGAPNEKIPRIGESAEIRPHELSPEFRRALNLEIANLKYLHNARAGQGGAK